MNERRSISQPPAARGDALDAYRGSVELGKGKTFESFVVAVLLVAKDANGDLFAKGEGLHFVRAPVHSRVIAAHSDVAGHLVQFAFDRHAIDIIAVVWNEREAVAGGHHGRAILSAAVSQQIGDFD